MRLSVVLGVFLLLSVDISARNIKGKIKDAQTGEEIIGASVIIKEDPSKGAVQG